MARLTCLGFIVQGGLSSAAVVGPSVARVTQVRRLDASAFPSEHRIQRTPVMLASAAQPDHARDPIADRMKAEEIMGYRDEEFRMRKFLQLVVLPLAVCFALVLLLRRGFLS